MVMTRSMHRKGRRSNEYIEMRQVEMEQLTNTVDEHIVENIDIQEQADTHIEDFNESLNDLKLQRIHNDLHDEVCLEDEEGEENIKKKGKKDEDEYSHIPVNFHVEMISETMNRLRIYKPSPPPRIPLCRLYVHESVRQVGPNRAILKATFREDGYVEEKGAFVVSMHGMGGIPVVVNDEIKESWDPIWQDINNKFEMELRLNEHWNELSGKMFLCWDGNHRTHAWMEEIHEHWRFDRKKHVSVVVSFIQVSASDSLPLLAALNRINKLNEEAVVKTELKDVLYSVRKLGESDASYFESKFTADELLQIKKVRDLEQVKKGVLPGYPLTRYMLAKIVFNNEIQRDLDEQMGRKDFSNTDVKAKDELEYKIRKKWGNRMSKLMGVVDPKHGDHWFKLVTTKSLGEKGFVMGLEKLNTLRMADVTNEMRCKLLTLCLGGSVIRDQYAIPPGDKLFRGWVGKEVFYDLLMREATIIMEACHETNGVSFPLAHTLEKYFTPIKLRYREELFFGLASYMEPILTVEGKTEIKLAAKRVVWRFLFHSTAKAIILEMPSIVDMWNQVNIKREVSMYSTKANVGRRGGMSEWEIKYCPWWIDFKDGTCLATETTNFELHEKGRLSVDEEDDSAAIQMATKPTTAMAKDKPLQVPEKKGKKKQLETLNEQSDIEILETPTKRKREQYEFTKVSMVGMTSKISSSIEIHVADVICLKESLSTGDNPREFERLRGFLERKSMFGKIRKGRPTTYSADIVLVDLPTSYVVEGPSPLSSDFNKWSDALLESCLDISLMILDDRGWIVLIGPPSHRFSVEIQLGRRNISIQRRVALRGVEKFGRGEDGLNKNFLDLYLLSRKGCVPCTYRERANVVDSTLLGVDSDTWTHYLPHSEWSVDMNTSKPLRGNSEKSEYFMLFLMSAFCLEGGVAVDLLLGTGTSILAARKTGVHLFGLDIDEKCISWVKKHRAVELEDRELVADVVESSMVPELGSNAIELHSPVRYVLPCYAAGMAMTMETSPYLYDAPLLRQKKHKSCQFIDDEAAHGPN